MAKIKCNICKVSGDGTTCSHCGADITNIPSERLELSLKGYLLFSGNNEKDDRFSSCRVSITNKRLIIHKIKPQAENPAFGLFKDLANLFTKAPYISMPLGDIQQVKRYDTRYLICTDKDRYVLWLEKSKRLDELFAPYKPRNEL